MIYSVNWYGFFLTLCIFFSILTLVTAITCSVLKADGDLKTWHIKFLISAFVISALCGAMSASAV